MWQASPQSTRAGRAGVTGSKTRPGSPSRSGGTATTIARAEVHPGSMGMDTGPVVPTDALGRGRGTRHGSSSSAGIYAPAQSRAVRSLRLGVVGTTGQPSSTPHGYALSSTSERSTSPTPQGQTTNRSTTDRKSKRHFRLATPAARLHRRPLHARGAGGSPSTRRQHAAAAHSKAWRGLAQPRHAAQDGLR
jgi:hypothetical protein